MTDLIIFDCDGVLVDSEPLSAKVATMALAEFGVHMDAEQRMKSFTGLSFAGSMAKVRNDFGVDLPPAYAIRQAQLLEQVFRQELKAMSGVVQMLESLRVPFCVGSNSSHARLVLTFDATGLSHFFEGRVFSSDDVKEPKPAPDLFLHAAARCGVAPQNCLVIEDSHVGVTAAVKAGMPVIGFVGGSHASASLAERLLQAGAQGIFDDLTRIEDHLCV